MDLPHGRYCRTWDMLRSMEKTVMLRKVAICVAWLISLSVPVTAQVPSTPYSPSLLLGAAW